MIWTPDQVLEQSRLWVSPWYPPNSTHVTADGYEMYLVGTATGRVRRAPRGRDMGVFGDEERVEPTLFECLG